MTLCVKFCATLLTLVFCALRLEAEPVDSSAHAEVQKIVLLDGSAFFGQIIVEDSLEVQFQTLSGVSLVIPRKQIKSLNRCAGEVVAGEYLRFDPNHTRLFFAPTARALKAGQGYFSSYELFFPMIAVGIGNVVSLAGGVSLFPGATSQIVYLAPKITPLHYKNLDVAAGALYIMIPDDDRTKLGIVYGLTTIGSKRLALTCGLGWGYEERDFTDDPFLLIGGEARLSNSSKFIVESWFIPDSDVDFVTGGFRFFGDRIAADFALIYPLGVEHHGFPFLPWLGFAVNFGK